MWWKRLFHGLCQQLHERRCELYGTGGLRPLDGEEVYIPGVRLENNIPVVLDSGADMSVLPMKFKNVGLALSKKSVLRDAQGNRMAGGALRQAIVELVDDEGNKACIKETFALSNVAEPLLALGKILKKGWTVAGQDCEIHLSYEDFNKVVESRNNALVTYASIRMVGMEELVDNNI